ncbi:MAG: glutamate-cysteine ligase family protein, partial [Candidatus Heimdallarchaeota archaeon]
MSAIPPQNKKHNSAVQTRRKLPFTHGMEIENFITNKRGDILEDGKELVAVWDQMFNGALNYLKSLTSSSTKVPEYIRKKIKRVTRKDVKRHGKIIRYVQIHYQVNGSTIAINVFGPDPNISQITWLLELVTPPCEYLEEMNWWINTLYLAASTSITKGYNIQPLGFNPFQSEYRAGVTCGEHHHLGGFKTLKEKKAIYNMIRAYIPHLIALSSTSPFIEGKPTGRTLLKKGPDGRTMVLAPDCTRSIRLRENSGQLGPNIPEYLPYVGPSFTQQQFSRYVRKEIPDDRYVDAYPFTTYGTIELRFFDAQYDQRIRIAIIILLQAIALKGAKYVRSGNKLPEV